MYREKYHSLVFYLRGYSFPLVFLEPHEALLSEVWEKNLVSLVDGFSLEIGEKFP